jgi:hypothetical protein
MKPIVLATPHRLSFVAAAGLALVLAAGCGGRDTSLTTSAPTGVDPPVATAAVPAPATTPATTATTPVRGSSTSAPASSRPAATTSPAPPPVPRAHFATPQAAMRYLAVAYNHHDLAALRKVTNASARTALVAMYQEAVNLQLDGCSRRDSGDYVCTFRHDYPQLLHRSGHGQATFLAAPADKPGWYMTVLIDCG